MKCPRCQQKNPEGQKFCGQCGAPLGRKADRAALSYADIERSLTEALEQQTATAEILRVISSSPTDVQPVFVAIVETAARLCGADFGLLARYDGTSMVIVAHSGASTEEIETALRAFPTAPTPDSLGGRAILERAVIHIPDVGSDPRYGLRAVQDAGWRTGLGVPLLREHVAIGVVGMWRRDVRPFSDRQIELLKVFADQAVIAIENARLFNETREALDRQTATSEILSVISTSPTDAQPVFDAIARHALALCDGVGAIVVRYDGAVMRLAADHNVSRQSRERHQTEYPRTPDRTVPLGAAIVDRTIVHVPNLQASTQFAGSPVQRSGRASMIAVPLLRHGEAIGAIGISRDEPEGFSERDIALLETFADQAVIAIENVRLFTELQTSNRELTTALDTQTATTDILRVISRSQMDVQPVFDAIVYRAVRLLGGHSGSVTRVVGDELVLAARVSPAGAGDSVARSLFPRSLASDDGPHGQAIRDRASINVADALTSDRMSESRRAIARASGYRSMAVVPLLRHEEAIGTIGVFRREAGGFTDDEIALLQTFADQAVIAIENARLLTELQARTDDLTRSVGELRALGEIGQAISSTLDLQTVLSTIVARATQLLGTDAGVIYEYDEHREVFLPRATEHLEPEIVETMLATPVRKGEGATGRLAEAPEPIQVPDILAAPAESRVRGALVRAGYRALLAVPLAREGQLLGGLTVIRKTVGAFAPDAVELLQTFATQSALAIQNARLFLEIEDKSRQLEVASRHKSEFLANMSHELRTPLNAVIGFSEVLSERMFGELNEKQDEYLKDIHASGQHLLSLINDILDLSKIEAGRMELEVSEFDLPTTIENALMLVRERAARRGIELQRTVDERLRHIQADERKIRQVLLNLLSNAIKFTPEGGRIDVEAKPVDGSIQVSVTDTGVGIAPEDQDAIFEEFKQVGTADKKVEGTGLGLALARKFIELHGGRIWVKSQVGQGSTLRFTIPLSAR